MSNSRRPLIAGNWKMNLNLKLGVALADAIAKRAHSVDCELLVCPPAQLLSNVGRAITGSPIRLGAQDCHANDEGAHTGEISAGMLRDVGCDYVILGHSERRTDHLETDQIVAAKVEAAWRNGLTAIICVGETEAQREGGETLSIVSTQISGSVPSGATAENTVIAYEPVWAIGSGKTPSVEDVAEVHAVTRSALAKSTGQTVAGAVRILYGGSVKPSNACEFLALEDVDGGLIGGASLNADDFLSIAASCP
ncbi:MAG: triose-phosphate isomerase [Proteobacteria bacterium]|nr:triose-phosphate isomerase [Pseudomonadota bacterium]